MQNREPVELIVHYPKTAAEKDELARLAGEIHADLVNRRLRCMDIPAARKLQLLDAVMDTVKERTREH